MILPNLGQVEPPNREHSYRWRELFRLSHDERSAVPAASCCLRCLGPLYRARQELGDARGSGVKQHVLARRQR